jgi:hypothetical protein
MEEDRAVRTDIRKCSSACVPAQLGLISKNHQKKDKTDKTLASRMVVT